jgi:hypothetical protein
MYIEKSRKEDAMTTTKPLIISKPLPTPGESSGLAQAYSAIKALEANFPLPTPVATLRMGTFNAATGTYNGIKSTLQRSDELFPVDENLPDPQPKPQLVLVPPEVTLNGVHVVLEWEVINGVASVTANGVQVSSTASNKIIAVNVGTAHFVEWTARSGNRVVRDKLFIQRPPIIGAGAFTVPALPVTVVYEPPSRPNAERQPNNRATYAVTTAIGNTVRISVSTAESATTDVESVITTPQQISSTMRSLASVAGGLGLSSVKSALNGIASAVDGAFGGVTATQAEGTSVTSESELGVLVQEGESISTGQNDGGPGEGDVIHFLRNARLVWLANGGGITLALLGYDAKATRTARFLRDNLDEPEVTGLDRDTAEALLALDPFVVGGPEMALPAARFVHVDTYEVNGADLGRQFSITLSQSDLQAQTRTTTCVTDMRAGALAFLGLGVVEDATITTTMTHSHSTTLTASQTVAVSADLVADSDELYAVAVSYDRVFGTFAFQPAPILARAVLSGIAKKPTGQPYPHALVTVMAGGRRYSTRADAQGRWAFHTPGISAGELTFVLGKSRKTLVFGGRTMAGVELR